MRGVNKVIVVGSLGADPEVRYTGGGTAIASLRLATNEQWTDKQTGQKQERTEWHRVKLFGRLAEVAGEYLKKGAQVYVEGSLRTDKYIDKDGIERYSTDIISNDLQMLGGSGERTGTRQRQQDRQTQLDQRQATPPCGAEAMDDDDIPFRQYQHRVLW